MCEAAAKRWHSVFKTNLQQQFLFLEILAIFRLVFQDELLERQ